MSTYTKEILYPNNVIKNSNNESLYRNSNTNSMFWWSVDLIKIQKRKLIQRICIRQEFQFVSLEMRESNFSSPLINNWLLFYAIKRSKKHLGFTIVGFKGVRRGTGQKKWLMGGIQTR